MAKQRVELEVTLTGLAQVSAGANAVVAKVTETAAKVNGVGTAMAAKAAAVTQSIESASDWYARTAVQGARVLGVEEARTTELTEQAALQQRNAESQREIAEFAAAGARYQAQIAEAEKRLAQEEAQRLANLGRALTTEKEITKEKKEQAKVAPAAAPAAVGRAAGGQRRVGLLGQTAIYTGSDIISSLGSGISPATIAFQQGPQVAQALAMSGVSLAVIGAVAAKLALIGAAASPLIYALNRLAAVVRTNAETIANLSGANTRTGEVLQSGIEARRREGRLTDEQARELQARARSIREQQARNEAGPGPLRTAVDTFLSGGFTPTSAANAGAAFAARQKVQEAEQIATLEANRQLLRDIQEAESSSHAARAQMAQSARDIEAAANRQARELELSELAATLNEILESEVTTQEERVAAISRYYAAATKASQDGTAELERHTRSRIAEIDAELERTKFNTDEYWDLMRERAEIEAELTLATKAATAERIRLRNEERRVTDLEVRRERERVGSEHIRRLGNDFTITDAQRTRGLHNAADRGLITEEQRPTGPNPDSFLQQGQASVVGMLNQIGTLAEQVGTTLTDTVGGAINGIAEGVNGLLQGTMDWSDALSHIGRSVFSTLIQSMSQMFAQWIIKMTLIRALESVFSAGRKSETTAELGLNTANAAAASGGSFGASAILGLVAFLALMGAAFALSGAFAKGGRPPKGRPALVGELGPELFIPDSAGTVVPADKTRNLIAGLSQRSTIPSSGGGSPAGMNPQAEQFASGGGNQGRNGLNILLVDDARSNQARRFAESSEFELAVMRVVSGNAVRLGIPT